MSGSEACDRPGCTGAIEDGYCNTCGMAPAPVAKAPAAKGPAGKASAAKASAAKASANAPTLAATITNGSIVTGSPVTAAGSPATAPPSPGPTITNLVPGSAASRPSWLTSGPTPSVRTGPTAASPTGRTSSRTLTRSRIGAGLVRVPPQPPLDPATALLTDAEVAEDKRFCSGCGEAVGRRRGDRPGRLQGFCGSCGRNFDFVPKLGPGDLVGGQYDVAGCLAHGGLGWIYLARDRRVADRWVVLKGLLDTGDAEALRAAVKEKRFLAEVEHPNIVKIFNFVEHEGAGYIVMEYVGGASLKGILKQRLNANGGTPDPLPVAVAIAYVLGILPAFTYLHERGYVYCDFKPDNLIQQGDDVKLIDLGGVRRLDDPDAVIFGTVGFQAPEIAEAGPSESSDLYTVGRTLAVLTMDFRGYQGARQHTLPEPTEQAVLARYPAFHRFLLRATATDPAVRFVSAEDMATQLLGVLRQVVAVDGEEMRPAPSALFGTDRTVFVEDEDVTDEPDHRVLPALRLDPDDAAAAFLTALDAADPDVVLAQVRDAVATSFVADTPEVRYRTARALLDAGRHADALAELDRHDAADADWRTRWHRGVVQLAAGRHADAEARFVDLVHWLPGELAPQTALALCLERRGQPADAAGLYDAVRRTDPSYVVATLGLARCRVAVGDGTGALQAFRSVARGTRAHTDAQLALARSLVRGHGGHGPGEAELLEASAVIEQLSLDPVRRTRAAIDVLRPALDWLEGDLAPLPDLTFLGRPFTVDGVRRGLEQSYRTLARLADGAERTRLVDEANRVRPRTLL